MRLTSGLAGLTLLSGVFLPQGSLPMSGRAAVAISPGLARFHGTWRMSATRQRLADGTVRPDPDLGLRPIGTLMFDATTGIMCAVVNNGDRARWIDSSHPTDAEAQAIWQQTVSYCASWTVDSTANELVYQLEANNSPNLIGSERRRRFVFDGDRLILYPTPLPAGVVEWTVEWRRASSR